jgi:glutaredoxin
MKAQVWTIENCPYCVRAKKLLDLKEIEYEEMLGFHPDWKSVPYITFDGEPIGGFTELARFLRNS